MVPAATVTLMPVAEKLTRGNHTVWKAQVLAALRGAQLAVYLDKTFKAPPATLIQEMADKKEFEVSNPAYTIWCAQEQQVLSYLLSSVSRDVLVQVATMPAAADVWQHLEGMFASQSHARVINTRMALSTTQKGSSTISDYVSKMKSLADDMVSAGKKLDDEGLCSYILAGLDYEYNPTVSAVAAYVEPITLPELYTQHLAQESRILLQGGTPSQSSANAALRGGRGGFQRCR